MNFMNRINGEILDLRILWKAPKKKRSRTVVKRYGVKKSQENHWMIVALALGFYVVVSNVGILQ